MLGLNINYVQVEELLSLVFRGLTQNQNDCLGKSIFDKKYESILKKQNSHFENFCYLQGTLKSLSNSKKMKIVTFKEGNLNFTIKKIKKRLNNSDLTQTYGIHVL